MKFSLDMDNFHDAVKEWYLSDCKERSFDMTCDMVAQLSIEIALVKPGIFCFGHWIF